MWRYYQRSCGVPPRVQIYHVIRTRHGPTKTFHGCKASHYGDISCSCTLGRGWSLPKITSHGLPASVRELPPKAGRKRRVAHGPGRRRTRFRGGGTGVFAAVQRNRPPKTRESIDCLYHRCGEQHEVGGGDLL